MIVGIRREDKNAMEGRVPLVPADIKKILKTTGYECLVQPSKIRAYKDEEFSEVGAIISEDLTNADVVFGIKEIPKNYLCENKTYAFFSHTIKGQKYNMAMLKKLKELNCTLIDYEKIVDKDGKRLVFFGPFAGQVGMIDSFWTFGRKLKAEGIDSVFSKIKQTSKYGTLKCVFEEFAKLSEEISKNGFPDELCPLVVGITGYGSVAKGAWQILDALPHIEITPDELKPLFEGNSYSKKHVYKVVFKEKHLVEPKDPKHQFALKDYFQYPEKYKSSFSKYVEYISILMNCIFWTEASPRFVTVKDVKDLYSQKKSPKFRVIGDITCDVRGSIEINLKSTTPLNPVYVYDVNTDQAIDGVRGQGPVVLAVDNLPCELSRESSAFFSKAITPFVEEIVKEDFNKNFDSLSLSPPVKNALILKRGEFTHQYRYMEKFLL